ncbi:MAG: phosphatase PAP2 family protein [Paludibacteraceae bacterium]|nr:phosphatase PAP2 family protein [Paludibacteraceae bacterium]
MNKFLSYSARILSILLHPMLMPTYAVSMLAAAYAAYQSPLPAAYTAILVAGTFILTFAIPLSVILLLIKQGRLRDLYIEDPSERTLPYVYGLVATAAWCFFLSWVLKMPAYIVASAVGALVALLLVSIINYKWKISAHLASIGALIGAVAAWQYHNSISSLWLIPTLLVLALLLCYARLCLNQHTPWQTVCGLLLGLACTSLTCFISL